jgi:hypothetical protein
MSFDLHLERFQFGESAPVDRVEVLRHLRQYCQDSEDRFGYYLLRFPDDANVEFQAKGLEFGGNFSGCGFHLRQFSSAILTFVFDLALAGDMVIFNCQGRDSPESPLAILVGESQRTHLPQAVVRHPILCTSPMHLGQLLGFDFERWSEFRDAAVVAVGKRNVS